MPPPISPHPRAPAPLRFAVAPSGRPARGLAPAYAASITTDELVVAPATLTPSTRDRIDESELAARAPFRRVPVRKPPVEVLGLIGVVIAFIGITALFAFQQPPFFETDEKAHLGYAHEIASFRLPEINTPAQVPSTASEWASEMLSSPDARYRGVWVANHPPLNYIIAAPSMWFSDLTDRADGGLLFLRLQNIAFAACGVVFTYLLATELTRIRRIGLASAIVVALVPQGITMYSRGMNDGLAFAAATGLLWAATRFFKRGGQRGDLYLMSAMGVVATGARTATMLLTLLVVGLAGLASLVRWGGTGKQRIVRTLRVGLVGLGPAALLFGWFYVRNIRIYGDVGGSATVLRYFRRTDVGSIFDIVKTGRVWGFIYKRMLSTAPLDWAYARYTTAAAIVLVAGFVTLLLVRRTGDRRDADGQRAEVGLLAVLPGLISFVLVMLTVAQHVGGGGNWYPRYFLPVVGVLATFAVLAADRVLPRALPVVMIVMLAVWTFTKIPSGVNPARMLRARDHGPPPLELQTLPVGGGARLAAGVLLVVGCAVAFGCLVASNVRAMRSRRPIDDAGLVSPNRF